MKCLNCGKENKKNTGICAKCGVRLNVKNGKNQKTMTVTDEKRNNSKVLFIIILCLILLAISAAVTIIFNNLDNLGAGTGKYLHPVEHTFSFLTADNKISVMSGAELMDEKIEGSINLTASNYDGTATVLDTDKRELYYITPEEIVLAADKVEKFVFSANGDGIVYINEDETMFLYDCETKKATEIAKKVDTSSFSISPNGKTVAYTDEAGKLFVYSNGKIEEVGNDLIGVAVADDGKYIYSFNPETCDLFVSSLGAEKAELCKAADRMFSFNADHSQILFSTEGKQYISIDGAEKTELETGSEIQRWYPWLPTNYKSLSFGGESGVTQATYMSFPISSFLNNTFISFDMSLYFLDDEYKAHNLTKELSNLYLTEDGGEVFYLDAATLKKTNLNDLSNTTSIAENVVEFAITKNGENVYYLDNEQHLWGKGIDTDAEVVDINVSNDNAVSIRITENDALLYFTNYSENAGTLNTYAKGRGTSVVKEDVYAVSVGAGTSYYYKNYDEVNLTYDVYASTGSKNFSLIMEGCKSQTP